MSNNSEHILQFCFLLITISADALVIFRGINNMTHDFSQVIARNLKKMREEKGWTQEQLSTQLSLTRPVISKWESGISEPSSSQLAQLAGLFGVSTDVIIGVAHRPLKVMVIDTSILINSPLIIDRIIRQLDEVIIPDIVIKEINYQKDNGKDSTKQRAWLALVTLQKHMDNSKLHIVETKYDANQNNDERIAKVANDRAKQSLFDFVYLLSNDVLFNFVVSKIPNLEAITPTRFEELFDDESSKYDLFETQQFISLINARKTSDALKFSLEKVDINKVDSATGLTPLILAVRNRDIELIKFLLKQPTIEINKLDQQKYRFTPLHHACQQKSLPIMKLLVESGADVNIGGSGQNQGNTPLMVCAWSGFNEGVDYLLTQDVSPNQQDNNGFTALHKACINGHYEIAKKLISITDIRIKDRKNCTADQLINVANEHNSKFLELFRNR